MGEYQTTINNASFQAPTRQPIGSASRARPPLRLPADCMEILAHGGFDPLIIEACRLHLLREYEPYEQDCGTEGGDDD